MIDRSVKILLTFLLILGVFLGAYEGIWKQGARKVSNNINNISDVPGNKVYVEIIWDASGSMWGKEFGVEKIIRSKEVLKTFTEEIPGQINLGLRIFGARKVGDLKDSFLAVPVQENGRGKILNFIANVRPLGKSPIGFSLQEATRDLSKLKGKKFILLVSDGLNNGVIPPIEMVNKLIYNNIVLHVIHIGNMENKELKRELKKMAELTGGKYFTYNQHNEVIPTLQQ